MLELILCSLVTLLPDFLFRRFVQGKRLGKEITLYSVWFELRWGLVTWVMLTIALITTVFYNHPASRNVTSLYRTVPIVPEGIGRVAGVHVGVSDKVNEGDPIFTLDDSKQRAAVETAQRQVAEVDAAMVMAKADIAAAVGQLQQARSAYQQALDELNTKQELNKRNADIVARREIEKLQVVVDQRQGGIDAAEAAKQAAETKLDTLLPAQKASAEAALAQAQVELAKTVVRAGVTGRVEQFALRPGDLVNPMMRSAGILIPEGSGHRALQAGFGQTESQALKVGMVAEAVCTSRPWTVIPMVVAEVQDYIAAGQFRGGEQLVDVRQASQSGTVLATLEPLYDGGLDDVVPGSSCIANAYTSHHEEIASGKDVSSTQKVVWHVIDGLGLVHALLLRIEAVLQPIQQLVFKGHG